MVDAPPEMNIPENTGAHFPRNAPLVTAGGLVFLATEPIADSAPTIVTTAKSCG